jgi:L-lactate dehydrogenase (cytochrome)
MDAEGKLPRLHRRNVPSAIGSRHEELRSVTTVLGLPIDVPFILAPVGSSRCSIRAVKSWPPTAAGDAGTIYTLSTLSGCRMEDVKEATTGHAWYQLYLVGGRDVAMGAIARARKCGYKALVVTIDTPVAGMRERDSRNGVKSCSRATCQRCRIWAR